uniref:Ig-like domain-containing protein n=1 Tax=Dicentrarchus labrax TaxID=13489 RepID=A0A8P4KEZ2_DICLA
QCCWLLCALHTDPVCCCFTECRAQRDNVLQPKGDVTATEGEEVTLDCQYNSSSSNDYLFWYKQDGNNSPKFILSQDNAADFLKERFNATINKPSVPLKIQKLQLSDSAVYYCALRPTVTGNTKTLYKNLWTFPLVELLPNVYFHIKAFNQSHFSHHLLPGSKQFAWRPSQSGLRAL